MTGPSELIKIAGTDDEIAGCHSVMQELRPHVTLDQFRAQVRRQMQQDRYQLVYLATVKANRSTIQAVAGFRTGECLAWGRFLYVDDLVTAESSRSRGFGKMLLAWLMDYARTHGCGQFHLDSGVQRFGTHRFYLKNRLDITSHHFALTFQATTGLPKARGGILGV